MEKFIPTEEQLAYIKELAKNGETQSAIAIYIKKDRCCVKRILKDYNIQLVPSSKNKAGRQYEWNAYKMRQLKEMYLSEDFAVDDICAYLETSESTVVKKARELGLKKVPKKFFSDSEIEYLKANAGLKTLKEMSQDLNKNDWVIGKKLSEIGISKRCGRRMTVPATTEFEADLANPQLSQVDLARKYNVSNTTIRNWRLKKFGTFKNMINTHLHKSSAEIKFEEILEKFDMTADFQKRIGKWKVDYYLGFKVVVEIQGGYWHDKLERVVEKDERKFKELRNMGYTVIAIPEEELKDTDLVRSKVLSTYLSAVSTQSLQKS